jgi:hypothetical protein
MNQELIDLFNLIERHLERIAVALESGMSTRSAPNYQAFLEDFHSFNWEEIGAAIEKVDNYGVATVLWGGNRFVRRSPENSYGATIYFSRCTGKDESGRNQYERLITFKPQSEVKVRPISREAEGLLK